MEIKDYQEFAKQKWKAGCDKDVFALGLGGETGEVLEVIKKSKRDQKEIDIKHLEEELGDVLWYVANLCTCYNLDMEQVMIKNVNKLKERYKND